MDQNSLMRIKVPLLLLPYRLLHTRDFEEDTSMDAYTPDFALEVQGVKGYYPAGEVYAEQNISEKKIPIFSCEGPCIRGKLPDSPLTW